MPWYNDLRPVADENKVNYGLLFPTLKNRERKRIIENVLELRKTLDVQIPMKQNDKNLLLASWNIKEFGHIKERLPESYFYIAEIINRFDLVAIQEIKSTLDGLNLIMKLLGTNWGYLITDITEGTDGNKERFAYLYDKRKVKPSGLSGEIVLWDDLTKNSFVKQLKRSPAITGFQAGWKEFSVLNVHLHPGNRPDDRTHRHEEIRLLMEAIKEKDAKKHFWNDNLILLGDTNLYKNNEDSVNEILKTGFRESEGLEGKYTNVSNSEIYDRVFLRVNEYFKLIRDENKKEKGGVFKLFDIVYTEEKRKAYHSYMLKHKDDPSNLIDDDDFNKYFHRTWKRNQISDHNPVWIEIEIDSSEDFLKNKLEELK